MQIDRTFLRCDGKLYSVNDNRKRGFRTQFQIGLGSLKQFDAARADGGTT